MRLLVICLTLFAAASQSAYALQKPDQTVTANDLANIRDIGGHAHGAINVSPDGMWVAFQLQTPRIAEGDYELTWMTIPTGGGEAVPIADGGEVALNPEFAAYINGNRPRVRAKWAPDSKSFAYLVQRNGQTQIWQSRPDRNGQVQLTRNSANVIDFAWSEDGKRLFYTTALERAKLQQTHREEAQNGILYDDRFLPGVSSRPVLRKCGDDTTKAGVYSLARACDPPVWVYELETEVERHATVNESKLFDSLRNGVLPPDALKGRAPKNLREAPDGTRYAWLENTDPETYRGPYAPLTLFALIKGGIRMCADDLCRAYANRGHQGVWLRSNSEEVIFLRGVGFAESEIGLYAWAPSTGSVRTIIRSDDWLTDCSLAEDRLVCLYETWTQPRKIISISLTDGSSTTLYDPNPQFAHRRFSKIEKIEWEDAYGNPTYGHLVYPIDYDPERAYPLVIVTYISRGFLRGGVGDEYPIHPLAAAGFFVLSHNMPMDRELEAKDPNFSAKLEIGQYKRKSVLSAQELIVEELTASGLVDGTRVAMTGLSEGSAQTTYALSHSDILSAAITSGVWDSPSSYYLMDENARHWWRELSNGAPEEAESSVHALSIGLNAGRVNAPLLVNISEDELLGAIENIVRLEDAGKPVEMIVYPSEHHIKWRPHHRLAVYRRNIQWLKFWMLGELEGDPIDVDQYKRWTSMCKTKVNLRTTISDSQDAPCMRAVHHADDLQK